MLELLLVPHFPEAVASQPQSFGGCLLLGQVPVVDRDRQGFHRWER